MSVIYFFPFVSYVTQSHRSLVENAGLSSNELNQLLCIKRSDMPRKYNFMNAQIPDLSTLPTLCNSGKTRVDPTRTYART